MSKTIDLFQDSSSNRRSAVTARTLYGEFDMFTFDLSMCLVCYSTLSTKWCCCAIHLNIMYPLPEHKDNVCRERRKRDVLCFCTFISRGMMMIIGQGPIRNEMRKWLFREWVFFVFHSHISTSRYLPIWWKIYYLTDKNVIVPRSVLKSSSTSFR